MDRAQPIHTELRTRYPGLASFTTAQKDLFFGRKQETRDLFNLISVERTVVLFSKSGYGKTSLLQAGVMPLLYGQLMTPVPVRFGTDALTPEQHFSIQFDTAWLKFQGKTEAEAQKLARDTSASETFWAQISRCPFGTAPAQFTPLFIFDQFEELFTLYPDRAQRQRFVGELADLIHENMPAALRERILQDLDSGKISDDEAARLEKAPPMRFVFSIRSDMLHFMDELSEQIPYILRSRYQLFGLNEQQATEAIVTPAAIGASEGVPPSDALTTGSPFASPPFAYAPEALQQILEVLSKNREVESFQLQAICQAIEEKVIASSDPFESTGASHPSYPEGAAGGRLITPAFYGGRAGIDAILEESYNRRIESLAAKNTDWPEAARRLLEDVLVNQNDRRKSVDVADILSNAGVSAALLEELERQRLLRKEPRLDSFYYEISHDTWLAPIVKSRKVRQEIEARERIAQEKADADRRKRRALLTSFVAGTLILVAVLAMGYAFQKNKEANAEKQNARSERKRAELARNEANVVSARAAINKEIAEKQTKLATIASKQAKTAEDLADQRKLEAEIKTLEAQRAALLAVESLVEQSEVDILNLNYEKAFSKMSKAANLAANFEEEGRSDKNKVAFQLMEIAYFYHHAGQPAQAREPFALAARLLGKPNPARKMDFAALNADHAKFLKERYFPFIQPLPGGRYLMGCDTTRGECYANELPRHEVQLDPFGLAQTETTFWQWNLYITAKKRDIRRYSPSWGIAGDNPAVNLDWFDACEYANWLSLHEGQQPVYEIDSTGEDRSDWQVTLLNSPNGYRLPTEAEWEYAARGGPGAPYYRYAGSDSLNLVGWYGENSTLAGVQRTHPVSEKMPIVFRNGSKLFDLSGNVWEWCWDGYEENFYEEFRSLAANNPTGPDKWTIVRVLRGGSWNDNSYGSRSSYRDGYFGSDWNFNGGFRLARHSN
ncbi:MAG: SUMF1/EgtB/PvdO family nonheme iron enzyme [Saprospiraceae bacterium]|nr:SUMF1/EgtB/PvdO family nonheme iron enzyme [Saprospiraceae bacterium]